MVVSAYRELLVRGLQTVLSGAGLSVDRVQPANPGGNTRLCGSGCLADKLINTRR